MSLYRTKDTGEALTLRILNVREMEKPFRHISPEDRREGRKGIIIFTFDDTQRREDISNAYYRQKDERGIEELALEDEHVAAVCFEVMRERKRFFKGIETIPEKEG